MCNAGAILALYISSCVIWLQEACQRVQCSAVGWHGVCAGCVVAKSVPASGMEDVVMVGVVCMVAVAWHEVCTFVWQILSMWSQTACQAYRSAEHGTCNPPYMLLGSPLPSYNPLVQTTSKQSRLTARALRLTHINRPSSSLAARSSASLI